ncbi:MAG: cation diffusion facilitator family transporter [Pseudobdellovibrionaceae bacterium]
MTEIPAQEIPKPASALFAGWSAIVIVGIMIFAKGLAYLFSGSAAVFSSLIDSLADIMMSGTALMALKMSLKPADSGHRYGHGKIEGLFALVQAVVIMGGASVIVVNALLRLAEPEKLTDQGLAAGVIILSLILTIILTTIQKKALREHESLAIESDHAHYKTDLILNGSVLTVLIATYYGAPYWIDSVCALGIAVYVGRTGYEVGTNAVNMLLDREVEEDTRQAIIDIILSHKEVQDVHDLRAIRSGMKTIISFDIEVDPNILLWSAHEIALDVERDILKSFPLAEIMIHVDPAGSPIDQRHIKKIVI